MGWRDEYNIPLRITPTVFGHDAHDTGAKTAEDDNYTDN